GAAERDAAEIAKGYVASMTLGTGQFCTKPGLLFAPAGASGLRDALAEAVNATASGPMLNESIHRAFDEEVARRREDDRLSLVGAGAPANPGRWHGTAALFGVSAADLEGDLLEECFGPSALLVEYDGIADVAAALHRLGGQLTASVHATDEEEGLVGELHAVLRGLAGRLVFGGYPTGVAVAWAMHHGG